MVYDCLQCYFCKLIAQLLMWSTNVMGLESDKN